jgi:hypothetical protein
MMATAARLLRVNIFGSPIRLVGRMGVRLLIEVNSND